MFFKLISFNRHGGFPGRDKVKQGDAPVLKSLWGRMIACAPCQVEREKVIRPLPHLGAGGYFLCRRCAGRDIVDSWPFRTVGAMIDVDGTGKGPERPEQSSPEGVPSVEKQTQRVGGRQGGRGGGNETFRGEERNILRGPERDRREKKKGPWREPKAVIFMFGMGGAELRFAAPEAGAVTRAFLLCW